MSKIVQAVNVMITNSHKISDVIKGFSKNVDELFFLYQKKHKWSVIHDDGSYRVIYYPTDQPLKILAALDDIDWGNLEEKVEYDSDDIGTSEAKNSFKELFSVVNEKIYNMSSVLNEIIDSDDVPF